MVGSTLSYEQVTKIREAYSSAKHLDDDDWSGDSPSQKEVAEALGHSPKTVNKWVNAEEHEVEALKDKPTAGQLKSLTEGSELEPDTRLDRLVKQRTTDEAMEYIADEMMWGKWCRENIRPIADEREETVMGLLANAVEYYLSNKYEIDKLREQKNYYKKLAARLYKEADPELKKHKELEQMKEAAMMAKMSGEELPPEFYKEFVQRMNSV